MKKGRLALVSIALMLMAALVAACGSTPSTPTNSTSQQKSIYHYTSPTTRGGTLIYSDWEFPSSTNPWFNTSVVGTELSQALYGSLFTVTPDGTYLPDELAEMPTTQNGDISKDGLTVTLKLNQKMEWSDGQPITSSDFNYWWTVNQDPATGAASTTGYDQIASIETPDAHTLVLHYKQVFAAFLFYLPYAAPKHAWGKIADKDLQSTQNVNLTPNVTSGPFMVQDYASGQSFTLVPSPHYASTSLHATVLDKLVFKGYQSKDALIAGFQAGETDHAEDFTQGDLQKLNTVAGLQVTPQAGYEHLDFNLSKPYLQDVNVRKAIFQAIDRCQIITSLLQSSCSSVLLNDLEPGLPDAATSNHGFPFSVSQAQADMKASGWDCSKAPATPCTKNGQPFPTLQLATTSGNALRQNTVQVIQEDLAQVGIPVNIDGNLYPSGTFFGDYASGGILATGKFDLAEYAHVLGLDSDGNLYFTYHSSQIPTAANPAGSNYQRINDPKLDQMLQAGRTTLDQSQRSQIYKQAQQYMVDQQAYQIPLYVRPNIVLTDNVVGNYFSNPTALGNEWCIGEWYRTQSA